MSNRFVCSVETNNLKAFFFCFLEMSRGGFFVVVAVD